jgi:uncharacterized protein involved in type VI secretion and phage assembly
VTAVQEEALLDVLERVRHRFYGKYRGVVTDVDAGTFRIKAKVPAVLHDQKSNWCTPCVPYAGPSVGVIFLPEEGCGVWIEFEGGEVSLPIWSGCYWHSGEEPSDAKPHVKAIVTKAGHRVLFDDDAGSITIRDPNNNTITLDSSGITLQHGASKIALNDSEVNVNDGALEVV